MEKMENTESSNRHIDKHTLHMLYSLWEKWSNISTWHKNSSQWQRCMFENLVQNFEWCSNHIVISVLHAANNQLQDLWPTHQSINQSIKR